MRNENIEKVRSYAISHAKMREESIHGIDHWWKIQSELAPRANGVSETLARGVSSLWIFHIGIEQAIRYASILLDISDGTKRDYDELFIERSAKGNYWIHFAVRPKDNRRKTAFIQT